MTNPTTLTTFVVSAALAIAAVGAAAPARAAPPVERPGLYVVADDVNRAAAFYEALFGKPPQVKTPSLIGFDVAGGLFAVVSRRAYAPAATLGGNVVPYLKVADIDAWHAHVRAVAPDALVTRGVVREGPIALFKLRDPDGNVVELFALTPAR